MCVGGFKKCNSRAPYVEQKINRNMHNHKYYWRATGISLITLIRLAIRLMIRLMPFDSAYWFGLCIWCKCTEHSFLIRGGSVSPDRNGRLLISNSRAELEMSGIRNESALYILYVRWTLVCVIKLCYDFCNSKHIYRALISNSAHF